MNPSEVLELIGHEHVQLRILFAEVDAACRDVQAGGKADPRPAVLKLVRAVWDHLAVEDRVLVPTLREIDGWGGVRAQQVSTEHDQQRRDLDRLRQLTRTGPTHDVAIAALALIAALRVDMDHEERDLLTPDLLRDDPIVRDQSDG